MGYFKYGILALGGYRDAYVWNHASKEEALDAARKLSGANNIQVVVFEILGNFSPVVEWEEVKA